MPVYLCSSCLNLPLYCLRGDSKEYKIQIQIHFSLSQKENSPCTVKAQSNKKFINYSKYNTIIGDFQLGTSMEQT